jgi:hypothetical protein
VSRLLALLVGIGLGGPPAPVVVSAYVQSDTLLFDAPEPLPWETWLPSELQPSSLAQNPSRRQELSSRRSDFGSTEVSFPVALPPEIAKRFYYLLDPGGPHQIRPALLLGTARIVWRDTTAEVESVSAFGQIASPGTGDGLGGFVLVSEEALTLAAKPSQWTADALLAPAGGSYPGQGTPFRAIVAQYELTVTAPVPSRWVFVQWAPDTAMVEAGCERRFSLFRLNPGPIPAGSTDYGCDV